MTRHWKLIALFLVALGLTALNAAPAFAAGQQGGSGGQVCAGDSLTVASGRSVDSVLAFGCNVTIENGAVVLGDVVDFGGNVAVAGAVQGNIITFGGNTSIESTGSVFGSITSMGGNVSTAPGAVVQGDVNQDRTRPPRFSMAPFVGGFTGWGVNILGGIVTALAFAAIGALVVIFAPKATQRVSDAARVKPLNTAGVGCITLLLLPILGVLLIITLIGIPVAFVLGIAAVVAWIFGGIAIGLLAGEKILGAFKARNVLPVAAVILGILVLMLIGQVPFIGWLVSCIVGLLGLGAVVLTRFGTRAYPLPPVLALAPAAVGAAAAVHGTYTPSDVDVAAWEAKARDAQTRDAVAGDVAAAAAATAVASDAAAGDVPSSAADVNSGGEDIPSAPSNESPQASDKPNPNA